MDLKNIENKLTLHKPRAEFLKRNLWEYAWDSLHLTSESLDLSLILKIGSFNSHPRRTPTRWTCKSVFDFFYLVNFVCHAFTVSKESVCYFVYSKQVVRVSWLLERHGLICRGFVRGLRSPANWPVRHASEAHWYMRSSGKKTWLQR